MAVTLLSPEGMFQPVPYHHVAVGEGNRHIHVAGQIARDGEANRLATGSLKGQVIEVMRNAERGLAGAGASFSDVVRLRFFLARWESCSTEEFMAGLDEAIDEQGISRPLPPLSAIGVDFLFEPDVLVELEAYAVIEDSR